MGIPIVHIRFDETFPELQHKKIHQTSEFTAVGLTDGMQGGDPSVMFLIDIDDKTVVMAETSLKMLLTVADAMRAKYGDPR